MDLKKLGFKQRKNSLGITEMIYRVEGNRLELVVSQFPLNTLQLYIRFPDDSLCQLQVDTEDDIKVAQRLLAGCYYENHVEVFYPHPLDGPEGQN